MIFKNKKSIPDDNYLGAGASGAYLLVLYTLGIILVISTLAAQQIQHRAQAITFNGKPVSIWAVSSIADVLNDAESRKDNIHNKLLPPLQKELSEIQKDLDSMKVEIANSILQLAKLINDSGVPLEGELKIGKDENISFFIDKVITGLKNIKTDADNPPSDDEKIEIDKKIKTIQEWEKIYNKHSIEINAQTLKEKRIKKLIHDHTVVITKQIPNEVWHSISDLFGINVNNDGKSDSEISESRKYNPDIVSIKNLSGEINSLRNLNLWLFEFPVHNLVTLPPEVLTLILVTVMGAIGGLIHLTQGFLSKSEDESPSYYLFRPILGCITALTIYILAKAGVLVVSDVGLKGNNSANLSPFFISFLAIVSGMLAENAIRSIRKAGENFLRPANIKGPDRWALRVEDKMNAAGKTIEDLVPFIDGAKGEVEDWIKGRKSVPEDAQKIFAAWLKEPMRNLFTDIEPPKTEESKPDAGANPGDDPPSESDADEKTGDSDAGKS